MSASVASHAPAAVTNIIFGSENNHKRHKGSFGGLSIAVQACGHRCIHKPLQPVPEGALDKSGHSSMTAAVCSVIRYELLPILRENSPSAISGLSFERLSLGRTPVTILGVKHVGPSFSSRLCFGTVHLLLLSTQKGLQKAFHRMLSLHWMHQSGPVALQAAVSCCATTCWKPEHGYAMSPLPAPKRLHPAESLP